MALVYVFFIMIAVIYPLSRGAVALGGDRDGRIAGTDNTGAKVLVFLVFMAFFIPIGFRNLFALINDEYAYRNRVLSMLGVPLGEALDRGPEIFDSLQNWVVSRIFPGESQWILACYAFVTYLFFVLYIYKQCDNFAFGIMLLFLLNIVNVSLNTVQQMEAVAVSTFGIQYIQKRKFVKYAVVILLSTLLHSSAIILIAIYFIANMKPWSGKFAGVAFAFVIVMTLFNTVAPNLFSQMDIFEEYSGSYGSGVKTITVIVAFIPIVIAFFMKSHFPNDDSMFNVSINMTMIYAMIYLVSTQNVYVARFAMYIQPYLIFFYTRALTYLKRDNLGTIVKFVLTVGYGATMIYFVKGVTYSFMWVL